MAGGNSASSTISHADSELSPYSLVHPHLPDLDSDPNSNIATSTCQDSVIWSSGDLTLPWVTKDSCGTSVSASVGNSTISSFGIDFDLSDHQYSTPLSDNTRAVSVPTNCYASNSVENLQVETGFDTFSDINTLSNTDSVDLQGICQQFQSSTSHCSERFCSNISDHGFQCSVPAASNSITKDEDLFQNPATLSDDQFTKTLLSQQSSNADSLSTYPWIESDLENPQTKSDLTDTFMTVEISPPGTELLPLISSSDINQTLSGNASASYTGTVTICQADIYGTAVDNSSGANSVSSADACVLPSQTPEPTLSELPLSRTLHDSLAITNDADFDKLIQIGSSSTCHQKSQECLDDSGLTTCGSDILSFGDVEVVNLEPTVTMEILSYPPSLDTPDDVPSDALSSNRVPFIDPYAQIQHQAVTIPISATSSIRAPIMSMPKKAVDSDTKICASYNPQQTLTKQSPCYVDQTSSTTFGNPIPSDLSSDALLSPSDVQKVFATAASGPRVVSGSSYTHTLLTRTTSNTSDLSAGESDASSSVSGMSVSCKEGEGREALAPGHRIKETLRSRLKAKRRVSTSSADLEPGGKEKTSTIDCIDLTSPSADQSLIFQRSWLSNTDIAEPSTSWGSGSFSSSLSKDEDTEEEEDDDDDESDSDKDQADAGAAQASGQKKRKLESIDNKSDRKSMLAKREKNRLAAEKCRHRKRDKIESLTKQVHRLEEKQGRIKTEVDKLEMEREQLQEMLRLHSFMCQNKNKIKGKKQ